MSDSFTENTPEGFGSRIGNSIKGVLFGGILFLASFALLGWNEMRTVTEIRSLEEGRQVVVPLDAASPSPQTNGKLVFTSGHAVTDEELSDPDFGVTSTGLKLRRVVKMYQWKEDKHTSGSGSSKKTTYEYDKAWEERLIHSGGFHIPSGHDNPDSMPFESTEVFAEEAHVGAHVLSKGLLEKLSEYKPVAVTKSNLSDAPEAGSLSASLGSGGLYYGKSPGNPAVGDLQVVFSVVPPTDVSIVARQADKTFSPYQTKAGNTIELLEQGLHDSNYVFEAALSRNATLAWILRGVGWFMMFLGLLLILGPIEALTSYIPLLGSVVGLGIGLAAFALSLVLSIVTVAICWIAVRPLFGAAVLAGAVAIFWMAKKKGDQRIMCASLPAGAPPPPPPGVTVS